LAFEAIESIKREKNGEKMAEINIDFTKPPDPSRTKKDKLDQPIIEDEVRAAERGSGAERGEGVERANGLMSIDETKELFDESSVNTIPTERLFEALKKLRSARNERFQEKAQKSRRSTERKRARSGVSMMEKMDEEIAKCTTEEERKAKLKELFGALLTDEKGKNLKLIEKLSQQLGEQRCADGDGAGGDGDDTGE
jgi:hypothetical protein